MDEFMTDHETKMIKPYLTLKSLTPLAPEAHGSQLQIILTSRSQKPPGEEDHGASCTESISHHNCILRPRASELSEFFESHSEIRLQLIHIVMVNIHVLPVVCIPFKDHIRRKHHLVTKLIFDGHARFFVIVILDFLLGKHVLTCGIVHNYPIMPVSIQLAVQVAFAAPVHVPALKILACKNITDLLMLRKRIGVHWCRKAIVFLHAPGPRQLLHAQRPLVVPKIARTNNMVQPPNPVSLRRQSTSMEFSICSVHILGGNDGYCSVGLDVSKQRG